MRKLIAQNGDSALLVQVSADESVIVDFDGDTPEAFPPFYTQSILARGYWDDYTGPQEKLDELLPLVDAAVAGHDFYFTNNGLPKPAQIRRVVREHPDWDVKTIAAELRMTSLTSITQVKFILEHPDMNAGDIAAELDMTRDYVAHLKHCMVHGEEEK